MIILKFVVEGSVLLLVIMVVVHLVHLVHMENFNVKIVVVHKVIVVLNV